jgi:serine/threonine protein phosphatase 1
MRQPARTPEGTRIYAIGDIHGRADLLRRLYRAIADDAAGARDRRRIAVHLGDYVDRGPDSRGVIDLVLGAPLEGLECVFLKGNHEQLMLDFVDGTGNALMWLYNGGDATAASYGIDVGGRWGWEECAAEREALRRAVPPEHLAFMRGLELEAVYGDYLFVHAGIRPGVAIEAQDSADLLWIREPFLGFAGDHGKVVVHGHTVARTPQFAGNRIGIDTGAYATGVLTALVLDGAERALLNTAR